MTLERIASNIFAKNKFMALSKQNNLYNLKKEIIKFKTTDILLIKGSGKYRITNSFLKSFESLIDYNIKYKIKLFIKKNKIKIIFKNKLYSCYCKLFLKNNNIHVKQIILDTGFFIPFFIKKKIKSIVKQTLLDEYNQLFHLFFKP